MDRKLIAIATITLVRNEREERLLRESLQQLAKLKFPVFITDGGSLPGFLDFLHSFPNFVLSPAKASGVWNQAKSSLLEAYQSNADFIFYTEPDKHDFFRLTLPGILRQLQLNEKSGIVLASRSEAAFKSFPSFQQMTETTINNCCAEVIGKKYEFTYGPFLLNKRLIQYLNLVQEDIGWGWRPYIFSIANKLGFTVETVVGDFFCPPLQHEDTPSERVYRIKQLHQNIQGLLLSTTVV